MKSKHLRGLRKDRGVVALTALATLAVGVIGLPWAHADEPRPAAIFSGLLNDYTPAAAAGTPYEMHGKWTLELGARGAAAFSAEFTMETADFANPDPSDPTKLSPHTHHVSVADGMIHNDPTDPINWKTHCPPLKPPVAGGFVVTGTAYVTANGGNAPFGNPSPVTICVLGGAHNPAITGAQAFVEFSNLTLTFGMGSRASTHFGTQAINGVVAKCERPGSPQSSDCRITVAD